LLAAFADAIDDINRNRLSRQQRNRVAYRQYRIQYRPRGVAERAIFPGCLRI
jgi:hypothetical protein